MDHDLKTLRISYIELAQRLGISLEAAKQRARRGGWRREPGNNGLVHVWVPAEALDVPARNRQGEEEAPTDSSSSTFALEALMSNLEAERDRADRNEREVRELIKSAATSQAETAIQKARADDAFAVLGMTELALNEARNVAINVEAERDRAQTEARAAESTYARSGLRGRIGRWLARA